MSFTSFGQDQNSNYCSLTSPSSSKLVSDNRESKNIATGDNKNIGLKGDRFMDISREDTSDNPHLGFFLQIFRIDPTVE